MVELHQHRRLGSGARRGRGGGGWLCGGGGEGGGLGGAGGPGGLGHQAAVDAAGVEADLAHQLLACNTGGVRPSNISHFMDSGHKLK